MWYRLAQLKMDPAGQMRMDMPKTKFDLEANTRAKVWTTKYESNPVIPVVITLYETNNNVIKNLEYRVILDQNTEYIIKSNHNELIYKDNFEIVKMRKVLANIIGKKNNPIIISSDERRL